MRLSSFGDSWISHEDIEIAIGWLFHTKLSFQLPQMQACLRPHSATEPTVFSAIPFRAISLKLNAIPFQRLVQMSLRPADNQRRLWFRQLATKDEWPLIETREFLKFRSLSFSPLACKTDEFRCDNGQCIAASQRCDSTSHCKDGSDEWNCSGSCFCSLSVWAIV